MFAEAVIRKEMAWFYDGLGLNDFYFQHYTPEQISRHVRAFIAAKLHAQTTGRSQEVEFFSEDHNGAIWIVPASKCADVERKIESKYFNEGYSVSTQPSPIPVGHGASLRVFLSSGAATQGSNVTLAIYILTYGSFVEASTILIILSSQWPLSFFFVFFPDPGNNTDIWKVATGNFLREKAVMSRNRYAATLETASKTLAPVIKVDKATMAGEELILTVAYKSGSTHSFFSTTTLVLARFGVSTIRKYIETFSNGITIYSLHLNGVTVESSESLLENLNLLWVLPRTPLSPLFENGKLSIPEVVYAYCVRTFAFHFMSSRNDEFSAVWDLVKDSALRAHLLKLKKRMRSDVATEVPNTTPLTTLWPDWLNNCICCV